MNRDTQVTLRFYHYMKVTRDVLEYASNNPSLKAEDFENRRQFLENALKEGELLDNLLKSNGENGEKVRERLNEFNQELFHGTMVVVNGENVRCDISQKMTLLNQVVGMRETFLDITNSHVNFLKENNRLEDGVAELIVSEDYLYRSLILFLLNDALRDSFIEFNRYLNESKGEKTPQSNFVANIIGNYIGMIRFVVSRKMFDEPYFDELAKMITQETELIEGKLKVEKPEDREAIFIDCKAACDKSLADAEKKWVTLYVPIVKELTAFEQQQNNQKA